jgi:1-deoxy-D-xylulose-5-phosphate reductoisomerase
MRARWPARCGLKTQAHAGEDALDALIDSDACTTVVAAIVGAAGLRSTLAAAHAGKRLLLANKESLVLAGELPRACGRMPPARRSCRSTANTTRSSSACPMRMRHAGLRRICLTASGGPFRGRTRAQLADVTPAQALRIQSGRWVPRFPWTRRR